MEAGTTIETMMLHPPNWPGLSVEQNENIASLSTTSFRLELDLQHSLDAYRPHARYDR